MTDDAIFYAKCRWERTGSQEALEKLERLKRRGGSMNHKQAYELQLRIRKESPELIAAYCLRSFKGPIGDKPWQVDANLPTGEAIRFKSIADYEDYLEEVNDLDPQGDDPHGKGWQ